MYYMKLDREPSTYSRSNVSVG